MWKYIVKRFFLMIPTLFGVAVFIFFLMRIVPGDIVELRFSGESSYASKENLAAERARFGLDKPLWKQFVTWMWGLVRLDFGTSMWTGAPILEEIKLRFALSLQLAIMATAVGVLIALPLGVAAALKQDTWVDYLARIVSIAGIATPSFWLGILMIRPCSWSFTGCRPWSTRPSGSIRGRTSSSSSGPRSPSAIVSRPW